MFSLGDRRILTLMVSAGFVQNFAGALLTITLPFWRDSMELTQGGASLVMSIIRLGTLSSLVFALRGDRFGRRRPLLAALTLLLMLNVVTALVGSSVIAFTAAQAVARASSAAAAVLIVVYLAEELSPKIRSLGMGIAAVAGSLAGGLGFLLVPSFDDGDAWRWLFLISGAGVIVLPLLVRFLRESRAFHEPGDQPGLTAPMRRPHAGRFWLLAVVSFLVGAFTGLAVTFAQDHLKNDLGWTSRSASTAIIGGGAIGSTGLFLGGRAADVWGRRPTIVGSIFLGVAGAIGFYWNSGAVLILWIIVASFGSSAFVPAFAAFRSELFPTRVRAIASSWLTGAAVVGAIFSLGVGYWLIDSIGLSEWVTILALAALTSVLLILRLPETRGVNLLHEEGRLVAGTTNPW